MLQNIRIVLVETSHTGNMGSVARAMKTMGLTNLWLVNLLVKPDSQAIALAAGASDVIGSAQIVDTLDEALAGCSLVVGTSARSRTLPWPMLDPRECGLKSVSETGPVPLADISERQGISLSYLEQLFSRLRKNGLVSSVRGPGGGYLLGYQSFRPGSDTASFSRQHAGPPAWLRSNRDRSVISLLYKLRTSLQCKESGNRLDVRPS